MNALSDRAAQVETQRDRLHNNITRIYEVAHAWCDCDYTQAVNHEFENALQLIDYAVLKAGALYVVELKRLADKAEQEAARIEKEGTGT